MTFRSVVRGLETVCRHLEDGLLIWLLGMMILLASSQIALRNLFDYASSWGDELLRLLVLWTAMLGAMAAARADRHISIDVLSRFLPGRAKSAAKFAADLFTAAVCIAAAWYSLQFVSMEMEFESTLLGGLPAWPFQSILPAGFGLMGWRYLLHMIRDAADVVGGKSAEERP